MLEYLPVAHGEAHPPSGHVERLGEAEELHPDILGAGGRQEARGHVAIEGEFGVGVVVDHGDVVFLGESHHALEEVAALLHDAGRGVVRVADEHELGPTGHVSGDGRPGPAGTRSRP